MTSADIDQALRVLNIEPLYGHTPHNPPTFRRALPHAHLQAVGPVYFTEDEEIDFDRVLREEKIALPKPVGWKAHWLAVEGVQPLIPENPPAIPRETDPEPSGKPTSPRPMFPPTPPSPSRHNNSSKKQQQQLVKQVLSRELLLYYTRLTSSLLPPTPSEHAKRTAALASLRHDAGLQPLLPYLVRWVGEGVVSCLKDGAQSESDGRTLEVLLDVIGALLDNHTLFVEPYVSFCGLSLHIAVPNISSIPASPTSPTTSLNASSFNSSAVTCSTSAHVRIADYVAPTHATLDNVPISLATHYEDPTGCSDFAWEEPKYARGCSSRSHGRRQRSRQERYCGRWWREGYRQ